MIHEDLKNYGKLSTGKISPHIFLNVFSTVPKELGFLGTPKFLAKLQSKERYWKKRSLASAADRGIEDRDTLDAVRYTLAFFSALVATCGIEKATEIYAKVSMKTGLLMYEEVLPSAEDFLRCTDPWEALKLYMREWFRQYELAGVMRLEVLQDTETDFQIGVSDYALIAIYHEAGYPEMSPMPSRCEEAFFPGYMQQMGFNFKRESWLCQGNSFCDWHFFRERP